MDIARGRTRLFLAILFVTTLGTQRAQAPQDRALEVARATMKAAAYCFLVTLDESGQPQARLMDPFDPEPDMTVWMATKPGTRKVRQIRRDPRATLAYYDAEGVGYVTLIGSARLVDDVEERRKRWKPEWQQFYPGGPTGDEYVLIEFTPTRIEVISVAHGVMEGSFTPTILEGEGSEWVVVR